MDFIFLTLEWLVDFAHKTGYFGVFFMTFLESTFIPLPSEITMIPVGYLVYQGEMSMLTVIFLSIFGAITGSLLNYFIAYRYGSKIVSKYGHYFFFTHEKLEKMEKFFEKHGSISTFIGRLIPGVRHFISFPAGIAKMDLMRFCIYTGLGSSLWLTSLLLLGYFIGKNEETIKDVLPLISTGFIIISIGLVVYYMYKQNKGNNENK